MPEASNDPGAAAPQGAAAGEEGADDLAYRFPTTAPQRQICFLQRSDPETSAYLIPAKFRIHGDLDLEALTRAVREVVRRHEILRTTIRWEDGVPFQLVHEDLAPEIPVRDLRDLPEGEREERAEERTSRMATDPFDLGEGPLLRAEVLRLADDDHLFLLTIHHVLLDHLSVQQLGLELESLYAAYAEGWDSPLDEPELQYGDYAVWHQDRMESEAVREQVEGWAEELAGSAAPALDLPTDRPRPPVQSFRGATEGVTLPAGLSRRIRQLSRKEGVTPFLTLLSAFKVLLHRYSGQETVAVGTPFANRPRPELEDVMGCFINTLPLTTDLSGEPTFRDLLQRVRTVVLDAHGRQEAPFERIVERLRPERDRSHNPLFQVSFTVQDPPLRLELEGLEVESHRVHNGGSKFDLTVWLWDAGERIEGFVEYDTELFDAGTVRRMISSYEALLEGAIADPDRTVPELPVLDDEERRRILEDWNDTVRDGPEASCLHGLVEAQADRTPDATALESEGGSLTYAELDRRAEELAGRLRELGVGAGVPVALLLGRSPGMVVSLLAVLKAGGYYVPLDPSHPARRLEMILEEAAPRVVLTGEAPGEDVPTGSAAVLAVDEDGVPLEETAAGTEEDEDSGAAPAPDGAPSPDDLAYLIYTSGSTGRPKGVEIPHRAAVNFLADMAREPGMGPEDRILAVTTLSFDISLLELLLPLSVGATAVLVDSDTAADGRRLRELLEEVRPTHLQGTPATWRLLLAAGWEGDASLTALSGGETLPPDLAEELVEKTGVLWNVYGPTEATVWATRHRVTEVDGPVSIGRPIANTRVHVLDENLRPVPVGVPGELCIGGLGVARGYHRRPDLTEEKFVPDPFGHGPGDRLYRTGDVARYAPDGTLDFLGRRDHQVKIRGFRIELGDVEAAVLEHPAVQAAAASVHEQSAEDRRLVAHVVPADDAYATGSELRKHVQERLPDYMVPRHFVEVPELPLTPNGKVDRDALPDPFRAGSSGREEKVAPRTETEHVVAEIWRELLGREDVGVHDNFFDLGGHSLLVMKAVDRIESRLGVSLSPRVLGFDTLTQIAAACVEQRSSRGGGDRGAEARTAATG